MWGVGRVRLDLLAQPAHVDRDRRRAAEGLAPDLLEHRVAVQRPQRVAHEENASRSNSRGVVTTVRPATSTARVRTSKAMSPALNRRGVARTRAALAGAAP